MTRVTHEVKGLGSQSPFKARQIKNCPKLPWQVTDVEGMGLLQSGWCQQVGHCLDLWNMMEMMAKVTKITAAMPPIIKPRALPCTCMA